METRKKITFDFVEKNFSIINENFLIIEVDGRKYIGRLYNVDADWFRLNDVRSFEGFVKERHPFLTFRRILIKGIFLPTLADIAKLGKEILIEYASMVNDTIVQSQITFLEEVNQILGEQEKHEVLVKKFDDFCNKNNIDEKDVWAYLNDKSEKERW